MSFFITECNIKINTYVPIENPDYLYLFKLLSLEEFKDYFEDDQIKPEKINKFIGVKVSKFLKY